MSEAVVDASVVLKLLVDQPMTAEARQVVKSHELSAPALLLAEAANALLKYVRAGAATPDIADRSLKQIEGRAIDLHAIDRALTREAFEIGLALSHSVYDCYYLALSQRRKAPLVTADMKLFRKAAEAGFHVISLADFSEDAP